MVPPADPCKAFTGRCPPSSCRRLGVLLGGDSCHNIHQLLREMSFHPPMLIWFQPYISMKVDDLLLSVGCTEQHVSWLPVQMCAVKKKNPTVYVLGFKVKFWHVVRLSVALMLYQFRQFINAKFVFLMNQWWNFWSFQGKWRCLNR